MNKGILLTAASLLLLGAPSVASAAATQNLLYRHEHFLYTVRISPTWRAGQKVWTFHGKPFTPPPSLLTESGSVPALPAGVTVTMKTGWNRDAIRQTLTEAIETKLHRDPGSVVISKNASGAVLFEGAGLPGRTVDMDRAVALTIDALELGVADIVLPVIETQPHIQVNDPDLTAQGIREVVTVGESDFSNSPANRRHNIGVGLNKFNGYLIPRDTVFSFDKTLGRVDSTTGYRKELVIKGDKTEPDYGGGLCQVSTTAYRGIWEYGFPIVQRINHSYTVSHYFPQGTDATVYPPNVDLKFKNDSPGSLLIQTHTEGNLAYFIYYGTRDDRQSTVIGPFKWGSTVPPPDRTEFTTDLLPGEKKKMGERVPGVKTLWFRTVRRTGTGETFETVFSNYKARPLYYLVGVEALPVSGSGSTSSPAMFMEDQVTPPPATGQ